MLTQGQLNTLRAVHEATGMPDTATRLERSLSVDTTGAQVETFTSGEQFACRLAFYSGNRPNLFDVQQGGRINQPERFLLTYPISVTLGESDRVSINDVVYSIVSALDARSLETAKRALLARVI
jgi:hypothetical protein